MSNFVVWFTKITGIIPQALFFKTKMYYLNKKPKIKGGALIISNHTSVYDYALYLFVFFIRHIYVLIAKSTYNQNGFIHGLMKNLGSIVVDRNSYDFNFMSEVEEKLNKNKLVLLFPEGRLPRKEEHDLLEFKPSFVYVALHTGKPIIPIYTNGEYGFLNKKRTRVMMGDPIYVKDLYDDEKSEKENIDYICNYVKDYIKKLRNELNKRVANEVPKIVKIFDYKMLFLDFVKWTGFIPVLCDLRLKRIYVENGKIVRKPKGLFKGKYMVISNHFSFRDPVILMNSIPFRRLTFIAVSDLFENKFWGKVFTGFGCIKLDREKPTMYTFKKVKERFNRGHLVGIFPEGGITIDKPLESFKSGSVLFSVMNDADVLPIYIKRRSKWYHRQRVYIGSKIKLEASSVPSMDEINNLSEMLRKEMLKLKKVSGDL